MLRHLLSSPSDEIGIVKSMEVVGGGQEFVTATPSIYYSYPQPPTTTDYNYNNQPSVIQQPQYGGTPYHLPIDYATPTSTSDLYSSTYAMLSADGITTTQPEWSYPVPEKQQQQQPEQYQVAAYSQPSLIHHIYQVPPPQQAAYHLDPNIIPYPYNYQMISAAGYDPTAFPSTSAESNNNNNNISDCKLPPTASGRAAQAAFSESFRKAAKIPVTFEDDCEREGERVMCLACKGVYTSRRSLTGHIGRNEKCREIIGRTYLETLAQQGQSDILPDPNSMEGGISPVCPNCNRFISHYKGNIRRHINQCVKRPPTQGSSSSCGGSSGQPSPNSIISVAEHYAAMAPIITKDNPAWHQLMPDNEIICQDSFMPDHPAATIPSTKKSGKISAVAVQSTNPYSCSWCKFTTVYKGNMKRHLISVHNCTDEILRRISFDLERLRALAHNRPITPLAPQPEKIRGCSGRRRKCRPKSDKDDEDSHHHHQQPPKRMKLLGENEIPPSAVSDVVASFSNSYSIAEEVLPISSLDSGISSGGSIDEC